jgi:translation initiation factor 2 subunit 2
MSESDEDLKVNKPMKVKKVAKKVASDTESDEDLKIVTKKTKAVAVAPAAAAASAPAYAAPADWDALTEQSFNDYLKAVPKKTFLNSIRRKKEVSKTESTTVDWTQFDPTIEREFTYQELLQRAMMFVRQHNPNMGMGGRSQLPAPRVSKDGSKKTVVDNFGEICKAMKRSPDEVKDFFTKELATTANLDSKNRIIIKGSNIKQTNIEKMLRQYIDHYVRCNMCSKIDTELVRDSETKLLTLKCGSCHATRTVTQVAAGFQAQTAKRSRLRAAGKAL